MKPASRTERTRGMPGAVIKKVLDGREDMERLRVRVFYRMEKGPIKKETLDYGGQVYSTRVSRVSRVKLTEIDIYRRGALHMQTARVSTKKSRINKDTIEEARFRFIMLTVLCVETLMTRQRARREKSRGLAVCCKS